ASVTCPRCDRAAEFHSHRVHTSVSLVGSVCYRRAYYLCRRCGRGLFPFDRQAGLTTRNLTPALERVATLAGAVADSFEKGADLLQEMGLDPQMRRLGPPPRVLVGLLLLIDQLINQHSGSSRTEGRIVEVELAAQ